MIRWEVFEHGTQNQPVCFTLLHLFSSILCSGGVSASGLFGFLFFLVLPLCFLPPSPSLHHLPLYVTSYSSSLCLLSSAEVPGQDFVTLDYRLRYYPSITYAVIGSAVIFVLVVALLALVLHHQRKRSVLLPRGVRGSLHHHHHHQPLLLSRLVILDQGHLHPEGLAAGSSAAGGQYRPSTLQLLSGALYPSGLSTDSLPSYSQAVQDARWRDNNDAINSGSSLSFVCIQRSVSLIQTSRSSGPHNDFPSLLLCWCRLGASLCFFSQPAPVVRSAPSSIPLRGWPSVGGWAAPVWGAAEPHSAARCSPHSLNCGPRGPGEHGLRGGLGPAADAGLKRSRATQGQDSSS